METTPRGAPEQGETGQMGGTDVRVRTGSGTAAIGDTFSIDGVACVELVILTR